MEGQPHQDQQRAREQYVSTLASRQADLNALAVDCGPGSHRLVPVAERARNARAALRDVRMNIGGRSPQIHFETVWIFWVATTAIVLVEMFVNKVLFDMALLSNFVVSLAASLILSAFLVFLAHSAGSLLRQVYSQHLRMFYFWRLVLGLFCLVFVCATVLGIMYTRAYFETITQAETALNPFANVVQLAFSDGFDTFFERAFGSAESAVMGVLNFAALFAAFIVGLFSHDPDIEYDRAYRTERKSQKALNRMVEAYAKQQRGIARTYSDQLKRHRQLYVTNGGDASRLPRDDFRLQVADAEGTEPYSETPGNYSGRVLPGHSDMDALYIVDGDGAAARRVRST